MRSGRGIAALVLLLGVVLGAAEAAGPAAPAPGAPLRVGVIGPRTAGDGARYTDAFRRGLRELGWVEGKTVVLEYRWAEGKPERLPEIAAALVREKVDVIFAGTTAATMAARKATDTIPIVMATGGDPVELGLVASLARPGGNVTGLAYSVGSQTFGKQLELLKELLPKVHRVAVLYNPTNPSQATAMRHVTDVARSLGVRLLLLGASGPADIDSAFVAMARERAEAVLVVADAYFGFNRERLRQLAAKQRLPAIYGLREHVEVGGLMSYSVDVFDSFHRAAAYVDKILKGVPPGELPVQQPTKFELVINLKAARALGLTVPRSLLLRADHVID